MRTRTVANTIMRSGRGISCGILRWYCRDHGGILPIYATLPHFSCSRHRLIGFHLLSRRTSSWVNIIWKLFIISTSANQMWHCHKSKWTAVRSYWKIGSLLEFRAWCPSSQTAAGFSSSTTLNTIEDLAEIIDHSIPRHYFLSCVSQKLNLFVSTYGAKKRSQSFAVASAAAFSQSSHHNILVEK